MITLFVRSYPKDYHWLQYSVKSMLKHVRCIQHAILCLPYGAPSPNLPGFFNEIIFSTDYNHVDGYLAQQFDKLDAWKYVDTDYILYSDSDVIYTDLLTLDHLFHQGKPILNMTHYDQLPPEVPWQEVVKKHMGFTPTYEYMRTNPLLHRTESVRKLAQAYPNLIQQGINNNTRDFSEFNFIGAFAHMNNHHYHFTEECKPLPSKQYWSWSGMTEEERYEIEDLVK